MGLLDSVMGAIGGGGGGDMMTTASNLLERVGGIEGLATRFQEAGLGDRVASWIGTGANQDVTPDEVRRAIGEDGVRGVAQDAGVSEDQAASGLASMLPGLVDRLTPDGGIPDLDQIKGMLGGLLGK